MANTYTQLYIQYIFSVKGRENLIKNYFKDELEKMMCGIISNHNCKTYAIYCNPDHTHVFVGMHPTISPAKLMEQVKSGSSNWLNDKKYIPGKFSWQDGYGAFTYSKSHIDMVVKYVLNQKEHHKKQTFKVEYLSFLKKFEVDYNSKYLFEWYDNV
ncbi:IS200/IS605 family transposase [Marinifilum breve]|uniref:IS200/IS605 family transposase n=1 Tax=Marinifilum breve TaxID=2184082 RepID=A0A2V3ZXF2_9BACT|nr:IS200/IS605 family transposase [Marinifilum breve]PXY01088.1 IS200/IS605 family transposase [Marinifilum breve]